MNGLTWFIDSWISSLTYPVENLSLDISRNWNESLGSFVLNVLIDLDTFSHNWVMNTFTFFPNSNPESKSVS